MAEMTAPTKAEREEMRREVVSRYYHLGVNTNETAMTATIRHAFDVFAERLNPTPTPRTPESADERGA